MRTAEPILLNQWAGKTPEAVLTEFSDTRWDAYKESVSRPISEAPEYKGVEILLASYSSGCYDGEAFVLFRRDGQLYEVNGSHCSYYGLEGQWEPEPTTVEALRHRMTEGNLGTDHWGENQFTDELCQVLDALTRQQTRTEG